MSTNFIIQTVVEFLLLGAVILTFWMEKALIEFEDKIAEKIRSRRRARAAQKSFVVREGGRGAHCA